MLLTPIDFLARLEGPALRFLNERIAAQFRFDEVGDDETVAVLHNQLLSQRDRRIEARGFRRGILVGLAGSGVVIAASIGAFHRAFDRRASLRSAREYRARRLGQRAAAGPAADRRSGGQYRTGASRAGYRDRISAGGRGAAYLYPALARSEGRRSAPDCFASSGASSIRSSPFRRRDRRTGGARRYILQRWRHHLGSTVLSAGCRGRQRAGRTAAGRDFRSDGAHSYRAYVASPRIGRRLCHGTAARASWASPRPSSASKFSKPDSVIEDICDSMTHIG